jgi:hypothetical protein
MQQRQYIHLVTKIENSPQKCTYHMMQIATAQNCDIISYYRFHKARLDVSQKYNECNVSLWQQKWRVSLKNFLAK